MLSWAQVWQKGCSLARTLKQHLSNRTTHKSKQFRKKACMFFTTTKITRTCWKPGIWYACSLPTISSLTLYSWQFPIQNSVWCFSQATKSVVNDVSKLESDFFFFLVVSLHVCHTVTSLCVYIHFLYIHIDMKTPPSVGWLLKYVDISYIQRHWLDIPSHHCEYDVIHCQKLIYLVRACRYIHVLKTIRNINN